MNASDVRKRSILFVRCALLIDNGKY